MKPRVFISYRQTSDAERARVRALGEKLRACGVEVVLDQFHLDDQPEGPHDRWDKWSSDSALSTEHVIIIGSESWFLCFEKKQAPGTGLGAACEADDLRHRIYEAGGLNASIRVVLFDESDAAHIPAKLKGYHRFHAERDFNAIVKWLGGVVTGAGGRGVGGAAPHTDIPHNLPRLQPFFGREEELRRIRKALDPENRTWGALIDGPGGMGKTSLAVRAAYACTPEQFERIVFVSLKSRELDEDGVHVLGKKWVLSGILELFNEVARELGQAEINKSAEDQRARLLLEALRGTRTLLVLDNLESLTRDERGELFTFVKRLPQGCKAILTSRGRIGSGAEELILEKLSQEAALETLAELVQHNKLLAKTSEAERIALYTQTGGKPLLLRWTAGQLGRGHCLTFVDALHFLRSCPKDNDPLEFIFGDLVEAFEEDETPVLSALTYFTLPAKVGHISELAQIDEPRTKRALKLLTNRSLVVPDEDILNFALVPMVADFLRKHRPEAVAQMGDRLEKRAYALVVENGYREYDRFPVLDAAWPVVAAALPRFLAGENGRLQEVCLALCRFLDFTGRWDERLALSRDAEKKAITAGDFHCAGWRAFEAGYIHRLRGQLGEVMTLAGRAEDHWETPTAGVRERAAAILLRGLGHKLAKDYPAAIAAIREAVELDRTLNPESEDVAIGLNYLAGAERAAGDWDVAERHYRESLCMAQSVGYAQGIATSTGNLAALALDRKDWLGAEVLARKALLLAEDMGRQQLIGGNCRRLAHALVRQGRKSDALPYARRAVTIFTTLGSPNLAWARQVLAECEEVCDPPSDLT